MIFRILRGVMLAAAAFFIVTFVIYFLNLDMKVVAKIMPIIEKHYDARHREPFGASGLVQEKCL